MRVSYFCILFLLFGCSGAPEPVNPPLSPRGGKGSIGVVVLIDTSGSMNDSAPDGSGGKRPKHQLAKEALEKIVAMTDSWTKENPSRPLNLALMSFSGSVHHILEVGQFDSDAAKKALQRVPEPGGGTAIGLALKEGWSTLKPLGCEKVFLICVTDGENTSGPAPNKILPEIYWDSANKLEVHFIAFDVSDKLFGFARESNGSVSAVSNKDELSHELERIFKKNILNVEGAARP